VVTIVKEAISHGVSQKRACEISGIAPRKFRRWLNPKPLQQRVAWNRLLDHERQAIEDAAWLPDLLGKPISHIFVHGHSSGSFFTSLSSVYRVLKRKNLVQPFVPRRKTTPYVSAHTHSWMKDFLFFAMTAHSSKPFPVSVSGLFRSCSCLTEFACILAILYTLSARLI